MTPDTSVPATWPTRREAIFQSTGLTPAARTLTSTSPAPGLGTGISCTDKAPPSPTCTPFIFSGAASAEAPSVSNAAIHARMVTPLYGRLDRDHSIQISIRKARDSVMPRDRYRIDTVAQSTA